MEPDGTYRKGRKRITRSVTRVPSAAAEAPRHPDAPASRSHEASSSLFLVGRTTSVLLGVLLVLLLFGIAYAGTTFFARERQYQNVKERQKEIEREQERSKAHRQALERRMVELETQLENIRERGW